ncbi:MAG: IPT/TIG domain-containing protein, partial [Candidatus Acidiferrum sp.]
MRARNWKSMLLLAIFSFCFFALTPQASGQTITSLSPSSGAVGASVTIAGSGFGATQGMSTVTFNGIAATATSWSADTIEVSVPSGATTGNVVVTVSGTASNGVSFTVDPAPSITSLSVTSGVVGTSVTITGTNFGAIQDTGTVSFNGTDATPTSWSATTVVVTVPAEATTGNVVVSASGVASNGINFTVVEGLGITSVSPTSGVVGTEVVVSGTGFGATQGSSTISLNGTAAVVASWTDISIVTFVPSGASIGPFTVTVNGNPTSSSSFTVMPLPSGWSDGDIGSVGLTGSATYANGVFTVKGAGLGISSGTTSDAINFAYEALSGDGKIIARVVSLQGSSAQAGVMIRETLNSGATEGYTFFLNGYSYLSFDYRASTGGSTSGANQGGLSVPYWVELIRSGNTFSAYRSLDAVNWTQTGSTQTISMAQSVYIGLAVSSQNTSALATATFDNVSINSTASPAPLITGLSATTGAIGSQVVISGTGFGATQNGSVVLLNDAPVTINSWSGTSISVTIPTGAISGYLAVSVAPSMNASNAVGFAITSQPLPTLWLDQDVGQVGLAGSATYSSGVFAVKGAGQGISNSSTSDAMQFVYQPLSGDGTIVARVVSLQGSSAQAGVMIRETLSPGATSACTYFWNVYSYGIFSYRTSTGGSASFADKPSLTLPYWVKVIRSGNTFTGYGSPDGMNWVQIGTTQTITMAQIVYMGLAVSSGSTTALATATFDNVSTSSAAAPPPVITSVSATTGSIGSQALINGTGFGTTQNGSVVMLGGVPVTINSWNNTSILITIPTGATTGYLVVSVAPSMNDSNPFFFTVTTQPLPTLWLDQDIGQVGLTGSATYASGIYTVKGAGTGIYSGLTSEAVHFAYQPWSGDAAIVARVMTMQGNSGSWEAAGVMIRESLSPGSRNACACFTGANTYAIFSYRASTGGSTSLATGQAGHTLPYWVKLVRSGNTFSAYWSTDGSDYWIQIGTTQTITMAQNVYIGLAVSSGSTTILGTGTFDNVSITSTAAPAPAITSISATTGSVGSQVLITGSGFGSTQNGSVVLLNDAPVKINSWSSTSINIAIPTGASSGYMAVSVAPSMNDSNPVFFTITSQPLPTPWLDQDVGQVGLAGSATFASGVFTVKGAGSGTGTGSTSDGDHFVYQPLPGDGTIVARVASVQGSSAQAGVMIRETLNPGATDGNTFYWNGNSYVSFFYRSTTGGGATGGSQGGLSLPYWVKLVRSGNIISAYRSSNGTTWTQTGSNQTITMAQNVYIGLVVSSTNTTALATATFDNVSVTIGTTPFVTGVSPILGPVGTAVTITGSDFGTTQGTSTVTFNNVSATSISSWTNAQIVAQVPSTTPPGPGPVVVTVGSIASPSIITFTTIKPTINSLSPPASQPLSFVTLSGSGYGASEGTSQVSFNGTVAWAQSWSDTSVTVQVPANATNGPVTVTVDGVTSNSVSFSLLEALSITSISQNVGPIGTKVTITGTGFGQTQSSSIAAFYGAAASVSSWSDTQIVATVATGSSSGPVTVTVGNVAAQGPWFTLSSMTNLTDSLGNPTTYIAEVIGARWLPVSSQGSGCSSCTMRGAIQQTYDSRGNILTKTNELGATTTYTYDSNNNVTSVSVPIAPDTYATTSYTYNSFGEVLTTTDPMGNVTTNTYDSNGNLLTVTTPAPGGGASASVTQFAYNSPGELTQITDPLNNVTTLTYTSVGLIATITDTQSHVTTYGYDSHGNRTSVKDANNQTTTFAYDAGDRLTTITYPDSTTSTFTYDIRGRRTSVTDQNGKTTSYAYDDADRLTTVTDAANNITTYNYDTESNLTSIQDANGHTTTFAYDAFGRVTQTTFPSTKSEYYYYDAVGNLITKTDRKNQTITYTYDQLNRLTQKLYPDTTTVNYTYDNDSRLTQVTDPTGTYQFTFDNMGRLTQAVAQYSFLTGRNFTTAYSYDKASNRTGFTDPENGSTSYVYDTLNRLQTLTPPTAFSGGSSFGFSYDALSRRTQMTRPNSITTNYSYDNLSRLLSALHQSGSTTLDGATYTVDNAGNRTAKTDQYANVTSNYTYDPIYELTQVTQATNTTESYTYDAVGNRLSSLGVSPYNVNASNELTSTPSTTYTFDNNGNTLTKVVGSNTTSYAWDYENRLTSVTLPGSGGTVSFAY